MLRRRRAIRRCRVIASGVAAAFDVMPIQVWTARPDGTLDYVNPCVTAYFCVDASRILEHGWKDLCHPLDLTHAGERWLHSLQTGTPYEMVFRLLRGTDRQYRWHIARATAVHGPGGEITRWVGTNTEIDGLKRSEEVGQALLARTQQEHQRWQSLFAQIPGAIIVTAGAQHTVELCSGAAKALTRETDVGGRALDAAFPAIAALFAPGQLDDVYQRGRTLRLRDASAPGDGGGRVLQVSCSAIRDLHGHVDGLVLVITGHDAP